MPLIYTAVSVTVHSKEYVSYFQAAVNSIHIVSCQYWEKERQKPRKSLINVYDHGHCTQIPWLQFGWTLDYNPRVNISFTPVWWHALLRLLCMRGLFSSDVTDQEMIFQSSVICGKTSQTFVHPRWSSVLHPSSMTYPGPSKAWFRMWPIPVPLSLALHRISLAHECNLIGRLYLSSCLWKRTWRTGPGCLIIIA